MKSNSTVPLPVKRSLKRLGQAVSQARRRRHFTQQELAERMGTSVNTVRRLEAGHPGVALLHLLRVLQVLGELTSFDRLLDTPEDSIGLSLMNERLPERVRQSRKTPETGGF
jgi:transcriptional regulator with XRE-family HTH domain